MFALFLSLILAMFNGEWYLLDSSEALGLVQGELANLGKALASLFSSFNIHTEGLNSNQNIYSALSMWSNAVQDAWNNVHILELVSIVLAFITSIGIVVMAVKGIKRIFSVFFYGVR